MASLQFVLRVEIVKIRHHLLIVRSHYVYQQQWKALMSNMKLNELNQGRWSQRKLNAIVHTQDYV